LLSYTDVKYFKLAVGQERIKRETDLDIAAKCPLCNDKEPRLHLYEKDGTVLVHCFRGECGHHSNLWNFIKLQAPSILESYKRETFGEVMATLGSSSDLSSVNKQTKSKNQFNITTVESLKSLMQPLENSPEGLDYLSKRTIKYNSETFGEWFYGYQDLMIDDILYKITGSIVIPLYNEEKQLYGFYSRSIATKNFITYNHQDNIGFKVWNWFNIDKELPVYIFEGIFDAFSSGKKNIIALLGAKLPDERLKELKNPVFCLDNDKTGFKNSIYYAEQGCSVYIQPDEIFEKDLNEIKKNYPDLNISKLISDNLYSGVSALIRLKMKN
jgi:Zn ribbon nucleic-acid-binding protein